MKVVTRKLVHGVWGQVMESMCNLNISVQVRAEVGNPVGRLVGMQVRENVRAGIVQWGGYV